MYRIQLMFKVNNMDNDFNLNSWIVMLTYIILLLIVGLLFYGYQKHKFGLFKRLGLPGPPPNILTGNLFSLRNLDGPEHEKIFKWTKKYGKVFGFYEGSLPTIVVSDPDIVQEVFVKQYSNFPGRKRNPHQADPEKSKDRVHLFNAVGPRWKRLRNISNPMFTNVKMKEVEPIVCSCVSTMMEVLDKKHLDGKKFDIYSVFQCLTMDVIGQTAFGIYSDCQRNSDVPFLEYCQDAFRKDTLRTSVLGILSWSLYELRAFWSKFIRVLVWFRLQTFTAFIELEKMAKDIVEKTRERKSTGGQQSIKGERKNFVDFMLEAELRNDTDLDSLHSHQKESESLKVERKLTTNEMVSQIILFLLAGFETTSTALGYAVYLLAKHQDIQEKLIGEIDSHFNEYSAENSEESQANQKSIFEFVRKLQYLDWTLKETLRLFPIAEPVVNRTCVKDSEVNGVFFPQGVNVLVDAWSIHRNPNLWGPDPDEFRPERHSEELKHPMALLSFGCGPRFCIGMRFALLEAKIALVELLRKYRIKPTEQTMVPLKLRSQITIQPVEGIWVKLEKR